MPPVEVPVLEPSMGAAFLQVGLGENAAKAEHFFAVGDSIVGRSPSARVTVSNDALLQEQHAAFRVDADECYVTNVPYGGECYVRFNSERTVQPGTIVVAGRQRLRVDLVDGKVSLSRLDGDGKVTKAIPVAREERTIGRDDLDPRDVNMSRSHLSASDAGGVARLRDVSRNGTFLELRGPLRLNEGDDVWMGEQRFRFVEMRSQAPVAPGTSSLAKLPPAPAMPTQASSRRPSGPVIVPAAVAAPVAPDAPKAPVEAAPAGDPVIILPDGTKVVAAPDRPMLSFLADAGAATDNSGSIGGKCQTLWECWDQNDPSDTGGSCGKCVVTILDGMAALNEAGSKEKNTIKKANKKLGGKLDESKCRLACQAIVQGPVQIQPSGKTDG